MTLPELSIKRPLFAWMLMTGLIVLGGISFMRMGISQLPDVDFPVVSVNIRLEGAAPEIIETEIVDTVEDAVMSIQGVRHVTSQSENSEGTVTIEFDLSRNIDIAVQDVQAKVAQIQQRLPKDAKLPTISKVNPEDQPIMLLTLDSARYPLRYLMEFVNDRLKNQFAMVTGVGDITLGGYVDPNLRIWLSAKKLNDYDLTVSDIIDAIQKGHTESPAGIINKDNKQLFVRIMGEATSVKQFENLNIDQRNGQPNYALLSLKNVAKVDEGLADITRMSRGNGVPGVGLSIRKQRGANAVNVARAIRAKVDEIQKTLPEGMHLAINFDSTRYIEQSVKELNFILILSILLTAFVCFIFLGSWSSTLNVLLSMPTSVIGTFIVLYFSGFTLNTFTLMGLSLSVGIVVDDAIIVLENIVRHQEKGKNRLNAAIDGSREISFAAIAATISIVAIFLPVAFMSGVIGKYFFQFGVTITVAVLLSLVNALTLTPMFCSQFVDAGKRKTIIGRFMDWLLSGLTNIYKISLLWVLKHRLIVIILSFAFFGLSFLTIRYINKEFLPAEDQSRFNIRLKTPIGSSLDYSDTRFSEVEKFLATRKEIDRYVLQVGGGSPGDANSGQVLVTMKDRRHRGIDPDAGHELSQQEFMALCRSRFNKLHNVRAVLQDLSMKSFVASRGFPVEFTVQGPDWDKLAGYSRQIMTELDKTGLVNDLDSDYQEGAPELHIIPDRKKAIEYGVSIAGIDQTVNAMIGGIIIGTYPQGGHRYDINVKLEDTKQFPEDKIKSLYVWNNHGQRIPLYNLVNIEEKNTKVTVNRYNRERAITVYANVKAGSFQQKALQAVEEISKRVLPVGYYITMSGSSKTFDESYQSLIFALILGVFIAYMVLAVQFNSFIDPVTVLMALPFSASGALIALYATGRSINIYSMIGLILLMGIVKKNSILLIDFTKRVRTEGKKSVKDALLEACPIRLRPILMTSLATIAGAVPPALSIGPSAESRIPMAIALIGGVIVSTLLTIFVVPCVYSALSRFENRRMDNISSKLTNFM